MVQRKKKNSKAIEHYQKFLSLWKDADPGTSEVEGCEGEAGWNKRQLRRAGAIDFATACLSWIKKSPNRHDKKSTVPPKRSKSMGP